MRALSRIPFGQEISLYQQKSPTRHLGACGNILSREECGLLRHWEGGLAYGLSADYSGGTAADSHGLPRFPCLQVEN